MVSPDQTHENYTVAPRLGLTRLPGQEITGMAPNIVIPSNLSLSSSIFVLVFRLINILKVVIMPVLSAFS